jgi:hypothetical protein
MFVSRKPRSIAIYSNYHLTYQIVQNNAYILL